MMLPVPPAGRRLRPGARGGGGGSPNGCGVPSQRPSPPTVTRTGPGDRDSAAGDPISLAGSVESASLSQPGSCGRVVSARAQPEAADRGSVSGWPQSPPAAPWRTAGDQLDHDGRYHGISGGGPGPAAAAAPNRDCHCLAPQALVNPADHRPPVPRVGRSVVTAVHS